MTNSASQQPESSIISLRISGAHPGHPASFVAASAPVPAAYQFPAVPFAAACALVLAAFPVSAALLAAVCGPVLVVAPKSFFLFAFVFVHSLAVVPGAFVPVDASSVPAPVAVQSVFGYSSPLLNHHRNLLVDFDPSQCPFGTIVSNAFPTTYDPCWSNQSFRKMIIFRAFSILLFSFLGEPELNPVLAIFQLFGGMLVMVGFQYDAGEIEKNLV